MELTYLGTAAAEGFPAMFCNCAHCREARALGGKNIRTRSQALVNDDLLIDFPADTYMHFLNNGIEGDLIKYLLITHAHPDHIYEGDLDIRRGSFAKEKRVESLKVFCSSSVYEKIGTVPAEVECTVLSPYETVTVGDYKVTPLPARHMMNTVAFIYIIEGDKTLLYAHDTGYFFDEVFDYIEKEGIKFDMISLDCTNIDIPIKDDGGHMGLPNIERVICRLGDIGALKDSTLKYINHFSHNARPLHGELSEKAKKIDCLVSYDGCRVTF